MYMVEPEQELTLLRLRKCLKIEHTHTRTHMRTHTHACTHTMDHLEIFLKMKTSLVFALIIKVQYAHYKYLDNTENHNG